MIKVHFPNVKKIVRKNKNGTTKTYYYNRTTGNRIIGEPGTDEFSRSYEASKQPKQKQRITSPTTNTFNELTTAYKSSQKFKKLAPRTQKDYLKQMSLLANTYGNAPLITFESKNMRGDFLEWLDIRAEKSERQADYASTVMQILIKFGYERNYLKINHFTEILKHYRPDRRQYVWKLEDVSNFMKNAHHWQYQLAMMLMLHTGQRQGDIRNLKWSDIDGDGFRITQAKTGKRVFIPFTQALACTLKEVPRQGLYILTNNHGNKYSASGFRTFWTRVSKEAKIKNLHAHDIRRTFSSCASEQGVIEQELVSVTGHKIKNADGLDIYIHRSDALSRKCIEKFEGSWAAKVTTNLTTIQIVKNINHSK